MEPKTPEEIYKTHLEPTSSELLSYLGLWRVVTGFCDSGAQYSTAQPDSARMNLANTFVNGFVNTGFCADKMVTGTEDANRWFYKNKEYGTLLKRKRLSNSDSLRNVERCRQSGSDLSLGCRQRSLSVRQVPLRFGRFHQGKCVCRLTH